jgi:bifunctional non-homologous end joining protein LigD
MTTENKSFPKELREYISMRDPEKTPEPFTSDSEDPKHLVFVVHKHAATALHYDLRLQVGKAMPSWAIPKGPSLDNKIKRLAMKTEDHPLDYRFFEGVIPEGEYGAGPSMIWDSGYYIAEKEIEKGVREEIKDKSQGSEIMREGIESGELKFFLHGKKLKGSFALVKTKGFPPGKAGKNAWLLIKHADKYTAVGYDAKNYPKSALSDKTIEQMREKTL